LKRCLLWILLPIVLASPLRAEPEHDYVGVGKCKSCHGKELMGDQVATWRDGPHGGAFETLRSPQSLAIAEELGLPGPPHEAGECLSCHATPYGVAPARLAFDLDLADGVQCESCHGPGRDYRKKKIMSDLDLARSKGLWDIASDEARCTACHNERSPTFDATRYTLPDASRVGFDFDQAKERIVHSIPEDVKGHYVELEKELKKKAKAQ
jgi:hypothetical protein